MTAPKAREALRQSEPSSIAQALSAVLDILDSIDDYPRGLDKQRIRRAIESYFE